MTFASATFNSADNGFMNMMVGPIFSRPLVQSLHASVSIGFLVVATLLSLLLPKEKENSEKLCQYLKDPEGAKSNVSESDGVTTELEPSSEWPVLVVPCYIIGTWIFVTGLGFVILGLRNLTLPKYHQQRQNVSNELEVEEETNNDTNLKVQKKWISTIIVISGMISIIITEGIDMTFQSQIYIYGLCGPLNFSPAFAGWLNTLYYANYMIGRLVSIPLSTVVSPTTIIFVSLIGCLINALVIVFFGNYNVIILFASTSLMAFHVCFMYPSIVTWITTNVSNVSSKQISFIMLGGPIAASVFPSLTAKLFNDYGPVYVLYTTISCIVFQFLNFFFMNFIAKIK